MRILLSGLIVVMTSQSFAAKSCGDAAWEVLVNAECEILLATEIWSE